MLRKLFFALFFFFSCITASHGKPEINEFYLKNGLHVVHIKKDTSPIVDFSIWYMSGSINDVISKSGVAHFLEHMAFWLDKDGSFNEFTEKIGADRNAYTSMGSIYFYEIVPVEHIESVFEHEAIRMGTISPNEKKFVTEKGAIAEERSMRIDNDPWGQFYEIRCATLFNRMPGGISVIGWKHEIESITEADLADFHTKWFCPNNAVIIIAGDIELSEVKRLAEKYFVSLEKKPITKPVVKEVNCRVKKEVTFASTKANVFLTEYVYKVPFSAKSDFRKYISLNLALRILNQPDFFVTKVIKDTVNKKSSISIDYLSEHQAYDIVSVSLTSCSANEYADSEVMWNHFLKNRIANIKLKNADLEAIKKREMLKSAYRDDDIQTMTEFFGQYLSMSYTVDQIKSMDDTIQSISLEECQNALKEVFANEPCAIFRMTPKEYDHEQE